MAFVLRLRFSKMESSNHARAGSSARSGQRKQKSHRSFRLRGYDVGNFRLFTVYRRLLLGGGALVRDSARSLVWLLIACAPPVRELMENIRAYTSQVNRARGKQTPG